MKAAILLVFLQISAMGADLRIIGTNLFDFSRAIPVTGEVIKVYPQSITLNVNGGIRYKAIYPEWAKREIKGTSGNYESDLAANKKIQLCYAHAVAISQLPQNQQSNAYQSIASTDIADFLEPEKFTINIQILHPPTATEGQQISILATPTKTAGFFDCGEPFHGNTNDFQHIYHVTSTGITRITQPATSNPSTNAPTPSPSRRG